MPDTAKKLPKFKRPPVVEVALAVQFAPLKGFTAAHLGLIWQHYRSEFPRIEQQPPSKNRIERTGLKPANQGLQINFLGGEQIVPRLWMISKNDCELIQVQSDRFARNWRRYHDDQLEYATFDQIRPQFVNDFGSFRKLIAELGFGELTVDQCEVTYVNHIQTSDVWANHSQLDRVFIGWSSEQLKMDGQEAESIVVRVNYQLKNAGEFIGRLLFSIDPQYVSTKANGSPSEVAPIFATNLVARGQPIGEGDEGVMRFIDLGHETIVKYFAQVTTKSMHEAWGRIQ